MIVLFAYSIFILFVLTYSREITNDSKASTVFVYMSIGKIALDLTISYFGIKLSL